MPPEAKQIRSKAGRWQIIVQHVDDFDHVDTLFPPKHPENPWDARKIDQETPSI